MKILTTLLISLAISANSVGAQTLEGGVQKTVIAESLKTQSASIDQRQYNLVAQNDTLNGRVSDNQNSNLANQNGSYDAVEERPVLSARVNHGERPVGVIGTEINENGTIIKILPASNLNLYGVKVGDRIIAVEGREVRLETFESNCRGIPGQIRHLTIVHNGQVGNLNVALIDARVMVQYDSRFQTSADMTSRY